MCFICNKYKSGNPKIIGPLGWAFLHTASINYPENPTADYISGAKSFLRGLPYLIGCKTCTKHANEYISNSDIDSIVSSRENLFQFFWKFHNDVNERLKKEKISLEKAKEMYTYGYKINSVKLFGFLIFLLILILIILKYVNIKKWKING